MTRTTSSLPDFAELTAQAVEHLGAADFYDRLLTSWAPPPRTIWRLLCAIPAPRRLFSLLSARHRRHLGLFISSGMASEASPIGQQRPLRLVDHSGIKVFEPQSWIDIATRTDKAVTEALAVVTARGPCVISLPGHLMLRRTQLASDFGPAPNGFCDEVTVDSGPNAGGSGLELPEAMAAQLTERERQVALKMLHGYPVIETARRLGLSQGTVKNDRLSIYRKLDITTERELFGQFIAAMTGSLAGSI